MMTIREIAKDELGIIAQLAHDIWPKVYGEMISTEQINYMLNWMYSSDSLQSQMQDGHRFFIAYDDSNNPVGFCSFGEYEHNNSFTSCYKLHKLYVQAHLHKKGIGKSLLHHVISILKNSSPCSLILNVNRNNPARFFYEYLGFKIIDEVDNDIGNGYFMNDYVMELVV